MTGPTKILTVSYGTFSCTLEGFDDPLGSMREMAEYFRDLAADDRYFGAEPPTPDVEMLQRIAEKEVQRRVEARVSEAGVALVAAPERPRADSEGGSVESEPDTADDTSAAEAARVAEKGPLAYDDDYLMSDEPEDVLSIDPHATLEDAGPAESVAEKLRRIRAVVSRNIELDKEAIRRQQAPNAESPDLRDRALSETISQIQADLADDEDAFVAARPDVPEEESWELDGARDEEDDVTRAEDTGDAPDDAAEPDATDTNDTPDKAEESRSLSEMIGSVSERVSRKDDDEDDELAEPAPRVTTRTLSPEPEANVGRLLDETDSKLNDDETVRRRRVISQMRAAVAATKADRLISQQVPREVQEEAEKDPYRADLSEAVQDEPASDAESAATPPPLVLVSSQRIDSKPTGTGTGAAEFAARFGAKELPELMEAAAAFAIFAEGQSSFTRPEIMQMVTRMDPSLQLSREESLRSFGQLLREGTFKKLERGQFTIDQGTKYNPEDRAAGV
jgi:hypothetical protein